MNPLLSLRFGRVPWPALSPRLIDFATPPPERARVLKLVLSIANEPMLRSWVTALRRKSRRVRKALISRSLLVLRDERYPKSAAKVMAQLTDDALLNAVLHELDSRSVASGAPGEWTSNYPAPILGELFAAAC